MGQQQLLLLVLATVIVGLATVAGIQAFEQGSQRANQDALTQTAVKIASDIQAKVKEPSQFGGYDGNLDDATDNITLEEMGYETNSSNGSTSAYETADGECAITAGGGNSGASPSNGSQVSGASGAIIVTCGSEDNSVSAGVEGLNSEDINSAATLNGS
jgi:hypothetical protein